MTPKKPAPQPDQPPEASAGPKYRPYAEAIESTDLPPLGPPGGPEGDERLARLLSAEMPPHLGILLTPETVDLLSALGKGLMEAIEGYALGSTPWDNVHLAANHLIAALARLSMPNALHRARLAIEQGTETTALAALPAAAAAPEPVTDIPPPEPPAEEEETTP